LRCVERRAVAFDQQHQRRVGDLRQPRRVAGQVQEQRLAVCAVLQPGQIGARGMLAGGEDAVHQRDSPAKTLAQRAAPGAEHARRAAERRQQAAPGDHSKPRHARQGKTVGGRRQGGTTSSRTCMGRVAVITRA
jgi:hypothetical protein